MSEAPDRDSKTEPATEKKKRDSIDKGNVPTSREALHFASLIGILVCATLLVGDGVQRLAQVLGRFLDDPGGWRLGNGADAVALLNAVGFEVAAFLAPLIVVLVTATVGASMLQNAPALAVERIRPKLSKISPGAGLKRLFGAQGRTDFAKAVFKFAAIGGVVMLLLGSEYTTVVNAMFGDPAAIPELIRVVSVRLLAGVGVATVVLVVADLVWSRLHWEQELRMTRQEVKDEHKQAEGDPILKARRLSLARSRARQRMLAAVPKATVVIANPTHYAIALRYVHEDGGAPLVLAKGQDLVALKIRGVAEEHGVPVHEDRALARSLYDAVEVDRMIPPEFYRAIAEILHILGVSGARRR